MGVQEYQEVQDKMSKALKRFGPLNEKAPRPKLIAVSKTFAVEDIVPVIDAGQIDFGENRVQEAKSKWPELKAKNPEVVLHLIGPLQTNKVKEAVALFDVIHSVDRPKLAVSLAKEFEATGISLPIFIQVNIGGEDQKAGIAPKDTSDFVKQCTEDLKLNVRGLMCIPPAGEPPAPYFAQLVSLAEAAQLSELSMGMSSDFDTAIEMGATHVRVGSAIFGKRDYPNN